MNSLTNADSGAGSHERKPLASKMRQWVKALVSASAVALFAGSAHAQTPFKLQHYTGIFIMAPVYVAMEERLFEKHGLSIELFGILEGNVAMAALSNGSVDAIFHAPSYALTFNSKNPPEKVVQVTNDFAAPIYNLVGSNEIIAACPDAAKPYPEPLKCLKGKRIGVTAIGSDNYNVAISMMKEGGLQVADAQILALGGGVQLGNALRAKQTDFILSAEPAGTHLIDILKVGKDLVNLGANPLMSNWSGEGTYALKAKVEKDPKKYGAFASAIADATAFINDPKNEDKVIADFTKYSPQEPALVKAMLARHRHKFQAKTECEAITNVSKWLIETGQLVDKNPVSCAEFIWNNGTKS